ncbi:hypothetical protein OIU77_028489 [Salix suchowensis]|uniref:Uncharacterized protein n=1 Tax=Salix suchowensis TaxID=1278906 RepID=A0ABQ9BJP7_9ROSI|nr:hypothetical protein OIU78_008177 [Salix suchowensis]KAJ6385321.1 hypothetical protein OIU77_028489 [Salix suchowensis]
MRSHSLFTARQKGATGLENQVGDSHEFTLLPEDEGETRDDRDRVTSRFIACPRKVSHMVGSEEKTGNEKGKEFPVRSINSESPIKAHNLTKKVEVPPPGILTQDPTGRGSRV